MLTSRAGFPKVSLKENVLTITLPDESNKQFYGETSEDNSPFRRLIKKIALEKREDVQLKQAGKELTLQIKLGIFKEAGKRIEEVKTKVEEIGAVV